MNPQNTLDKIAAALDLKTLYNEFQISLKKSGEHNATSYLKCKIEDPIRTALSTGYYGIEIGHNANSNHEDGAPVHSIIFRNMDAENDPTWASCLYRLEGEFKLKSLGLSDAKKQKFIREVEAEHQEDMEDSY